MIYGHIEPWMADENPAFTEAVRAYYSLEHGTRNDAAIGEIAARKMAGELLKRGQLEDLDRVALLGQLAAAMLKDQAAIERGDGNYFRRLSFVLDHGGSYQHDPIEYIFEAYLYLRRRAGQGSPLPTKREVKQIASLIWAFKDVGIMSKLAEYLWRNTGLSSKELSTVLYRQEQHLAGKDKENWAYWLKQAGLSGLKQSRRHSVK